MKFKELKALGDVYLEAVYGQSAGQELAKREKDDDAAGAPRKATPESGTGKYYKEGKPTDKQKEVRAKQEKIRAASNRGKQYTEELVVEKDSYKTVAAVIDYDRSKKGTDDAVYDTEHGKKKKAKQERDYAAWERSKMKKDDPNWKHKKGSTSESVQDLANVYIEGVLKKEVKALKKGAETLKGKDVAKADEIADEYVPSETVKKLVESGKFTKEEILKIVEVESLGK